MAENSEPRPSALRGDSLGLDIGGARNGEDMNGEERDDKAKGPARMQKGREKNSLGELRSRRRKGFGNRRGEREAKDGAKDKKRRSNYSFWGFNERGDSTSRICFISLISPKKKLPLFSSFDFFENDSSFHDFLSRGLPHNKP